MNRNRGQIRPAGVALLALLGSFVGIFLVLWGLGAFLVTGDTLEPSDAFVLLSGGDDARLQEVVRLYHDGYGRTVILTETGETIAGSGEDYLDTLRNDLIQAGVSSDAIIQTAKAADSTATEAQRVLDLVKQRGISSATVVTDPYHTRRAQLIYRRAFAGSGVRVGIHPVQGHWYRSSTWFLHREGWKMTVLELVKLASDWTGIPKP